MKIVMCIKKGGNPFTLKKHIADANKPHSAQWRAQSLCGIHPIAILGDESWAKDWKNNRKVCKNCKKIALEL